VVPSKNAIALAPTSAKSDWFGLAWKGAAWALLLGSIVYYVRRDALHYLFNYSSESFKEFWSERILIRMHVASAVTMIFTGTFQLWTGLRMRHMVFHTWLGRVYLLAGVFVGCSALYMGMHPRLRGIVYGFGLFLNGLFWLAAAAMAYYAIRAGNVQAHKIWMIRAYILCFAGIVGDRIIPDMTFVSKRVGTEALNDISGWANWAVPLMVVEVLMQIRSFRKKPHRSS
jgi:uncharacterized membrane protein